ncbi:hypothetical protein OFAG_02251 [Oxalobacter formigenes HOxBLS]|uniref:Uncharacterized protein n=1 Tax=Oxalobacter paraformigenes TaxID=556268 RepID=T5LQD7_9BURK|nr:hypothetical protein OFAG_02251 [Oxalobacter paraformigenes]
METPLSTGRKNGPYALFKIRKYGKTGMLCFFYHVFCFLFRRHDGRPRCAISREELEKRQNESGNEIYWL